MRLRTVTPTSAFVPLCFISPGRFLRRSMSRAALLALALSPAAATPVTGQPISPSPHFGASTIPSRQVGSFLGVSFDRFTPTGKVTEPGVYNAIDRTMGFNFLSYSTVRASRRWPSVTRQSSLQLGWGHNEPTAWIQKRLHRLAGLPGVETTNPRNNVLDATLNVEFTKWDAMSDFASLFTGAGVSVGTPHSEGWLQLGAASEPLRRWPDLAVAVRFGVPFLGGAFPHSTLARAYLALEAKAELPLGSWLDVSWLPSPFLSVRQDSGFFVDVSGRRIPELHGSFGFASPDHSWRFEVWNEYFGGRFKDIGPTGGGRFVVRLPGG